METVNLSLDTEGARCDHPGLKGWGMLTRLPLGEHPAKKTVPNQSNHAYDKGQGEKGDKIEYHGSGNGTHLLFHFRHLHSAYLSALPATTVPIAAPTTPPNRLTGRPKHGRRPASPKVLSKVLSISANQRLSEPFFPAIIQAAFEHKALPSGVVAAQGNLDPLVQVQFLARQPTPQLHRRRTDHHFLHSRTRRTSRTAATAGRQLELVSSQLRWPTLSKKEARDSGWHQRLSLQRSENQTESVDTGCSGRR